MIASIRTPRRLALAEGSIKGRFRASRTLRTLRGVSSFGGRGYHLLLENDPKGTCLARTFLSDNHDGCKGALVTARAASDE